ncbi:MAG TPA: hypothetical protein DCQ98_21765 [Planctomycetaceae bacterium]|nr:hypothetical protein [Planctomycetaceae bacterium]HRF01155.1 polysaccharide pyruvyl transferase family protein [Pirellulaceae bacterium]
MINLFCIRPKGFNVGNDAIYLGMQHFIYNAFGEVVNLINLPATSRYESQAKAGLTSKTIYEINQYGHGVIIGGGNLFENGELDVQLDALGALEVPLMVFSVSRGRVYNRRLELVRRTDTMPDRILKALDERVDFALLRDRATSEHMASIGCRNTTIGGCPTIYLDRMMHRLPDVPGALDRTALVSVRTPDLMSIPLEKQARVRNDILDILALLRQRGYGDVRLLCHDHRDIAFAASFSDVDYVYTGDVMTYLALLSRCALNVTYRLHSFLPCVSFGCPTIKISYDERALSLIDTLGLGEWNINMIEEPNLMGAIRDRMDRMDDLDRLKRANAPLWQAFYDQFDSTFRQFAGEVHAYHDAVEPKRPPVLRLAA